MKFNQTKKSVAERTENENYEGGQAFEAEDPRLALTKVVINNLLEDSFYETAEEKFEAVEREFDSCVEDYPEFILKLSKYARQEENLRQVPQALFVLAVEDERTRPFAEDYARGIMSRTDEPLDVLALWVSRNGTSIPGVLKRSIEDAMHQWNEWQYAKWDQSNKEWQYRDLLNLVHPKPRDDERERIFEKIAYGDLDDYGVEPLKQEDTWESSLSDDSDSRSKAEKYLDSLSEPNPMGLFPRIRQARDMIDAGVAADDIYGDVTDDWIRNSRLYPFRFYQAYKALRQARDLDTEEKRAAMDFLEDAMKVSTDSLPDVLEDTFVAVDISGSMRSAVSNDSDLECVEISSLFGALVYERGADLSAFASSIQEFHDDRRNPITTNMDSIRNMGVGGGTNGYLIPQALREYSRDEYNQVIVFTDMQMWNSGYGSETFKSEWEQYKQEVNPEASLYLVDLQNYGTLQVPEGANDVYQLQGWTSKIVDYIDNMENVDGMVREIEAVEPDE